MKSRSIGAGAAAAAADADVGDAPGAPVAVAFDAELVAAPFVAGAPSAACETLIDPAPAAGAFVVAPRVAGGALAGAGGALSVGREPAGKAGLGDGGLSGIRLKVEAEIADAAGLGVEAAGGGLSVELEVAGAVELAVEAEPAGAAALVGFTESLGRTA